MLTFSVAPIDYPVAGRGVTSIANILGSNVFDPLVCIPAGIVIAGAAVINFPIAAPMMGVLTAATIALFLMMHTDMVLSRIESAVLLVICAGLPPPSAVGAAH